MQGSLATSLREAVAGDPALTELRDRLKEHLYRGLSPWDDQRRARAARRLQYMSPGLPRVIRPATYSAANVSAEPYYNPSAADFQREKLAHEIRCRLGTLVGAIFDELRGGQLAATGMLLSGERVAVPPAVWSAPSVTLDLVTGVLSTAGATMFSDIEVDQPPARGSCSRATLDRFIADFDAALSARGRCFTGPELVRAAKQGLGDGASEREVYNALRRASGLSALAGRGRRAAAIAPSPAELLAAASQAAEIRP